MRRLTTLLLGAALALPALPALGQTDATVPSAATVLRSMVEAPALIDYEGTKIISVRRSGGTQTVTVLEAHKRSGKMRLEFLSPEPIAGRIIIDTGADFWHYEPSLHIVFQGPTLSHPASPRATSAALASAYHIQVLGTEEVVGRAAFVLWLGARRGEESRTFWVDQATGIPLRIEERRRGEPVYVAYFSRISFSLNLPEALFRFHLPAGARSFSLFPSREAGMSLSQVERQVGFQVRQPAALPAGLRFAGASVAQYGSLTAAHLRYTDGTQPISVFQVPARRVATMGQPGPIEEVLAGGVRMRVVDLGYFRLLSWEERGLHLAIVSSHQSGTLLTLARAFIGR
ncbi:MAG TPA: sigma-E factor regulatory protein RseB domain-containing protein [bacterium]|nr:sigma-E factor regulatory protein RseB domain-containing protein [bacterium]